jgi:hypothetical protein
MNQLEELNLTLRLSHSGGQAYMTLEGPSFERMRFEHLDELLRYLRVLTEPRAKRGLR